MTYVQDNDYYGHGAMVVLDARTRKQVLSCENLSAISLFSADSRCRNCPPCSGLHTGGKRTVPPSGQSRLAARRTGVHPAQTGRFCCSMYWCRTLIGAPATLPAK